MKVLLDECLPVAFRCHLPGHEVHSASWAGFTGKNNGELLVAAELAGYDVLLTVDQGIPHEQNLSGRKLAILLVRSKTNQIEDLEPLSDAILAALNTIRAGQLMVVG